MRSDDIIKLSEDIRQQDFETRIQRLKTRIQKIRQEIGGGSTPTLKADLSDHEDMLAKAEVNYKKYMNK